MEFVSRLRWLIIIFVMIVFLILVGWGLSSIARNIFGSSTDNAVIEESGNGTVTAEIGVARMTVSGDITATEEQRSYTIEVNPQTVTITLFSNYGQKQLKQESYVNNQKSYDAFLLALDHANAVTLRSGSTVEKTLDFVGICPFGRTYVLNFDDDFQSWFTSCDSNQGTAAGSVGTIKTLFNSQAPDASEILQGTGLYVQ